MANHSQDFYRGLILRDDRFSGTNATVTPAEQQANPKVGEPTVTGGQGHMDLEATGYSTAEQKYDIRCVKPGYAKGEWNSARFAWKNQSEAATSYRGWWPYSDVTSCSVWAAQLVARIPTAWPSAITSKDGWVHIVYCQMNMSGSGMGIDKIYVDTLNPNTDVWTSVDVTTAVQSQITLSADPAALVELPSGRILLITAGTDTLYSDDRCATWGTIQHEPTATASNFGMLAPDFAAGIDSIVRFHAVYHNGFITALREVQGEIAGVKAQEVDHYVSKDFGISWTLVERIQPGLSGGPLGSGTSVANVHDPMLSTDAMGQVIMIYADKEDNADQDRRLKYTRKTTPYAKFVENGDFDKNLGSANPAGNFVLCKDPEGFLTVIRQGGKTSSALNTGRTYIYRYDTRDLGNIISDQRNQGTIQALSDTGGASKQYELLSQDGEPHATWAASKIVEKITRSTVTPYKGGLLLLTGGYSDKEAGMNASPGRGADILITLGGYTNYDEDSRQNVLSPGRIWLPTETPDNIAGGSAVLAESGVVANTAFSIEDGTTHPAGCRFHTTPSGRHSFAFSGTPVTGIYARFRGQTDVGRLTVGGVVHVNANYAVINVGGVELRIGKDAAQVWDKTGASPSWAPCSAVFELSDEDRDWVVTYDSDDEAWVMYKKPSEQVWTKLTTTTLGATPGTSHVWGHDNTGVLTSTWNYVGAKYVNKPADEWKKAAYHPNRLYGRNLSLYPVHLSDGWSIESKGAVAFVGDHWQAETAYGHAVRLMHPEIAPSPRIDWRSTSDKSEVTVEWNPANGTDTRPLGGAVGVHLQDINFKTAHFEGWNGAAWVTLGSFNTAKDFSGLKFARDGNILRPNPAVTHGAGRYVKLEELKGCTAIIAPGTGGETRHRIDQNSEGSFSATAPNEHGKPAELLISGSVSSVAATGDFEIWEKQGTLVMWGRMTAYDKFRLRIPAQDTVDGFFKIGACVIGPLLVFGHDYSWGRSTAYTPNQEITTARAGDRIVEELGPIRRTVQFAWAEGWDARPIGGASATDFDTISAGSTYGVGVRSDPFVMSGAMYRLRGAAEPTVYLPHIPHDADNSGSEMIVGKDRQVYGRIVSPVTQTSILGDEEESEVITLNQIVIEEEV